MPTPEEITRHHEWTPPDGEDIRVDRRPRPEPVVIVAYDPPGPDAYGLVATATATGEQVMDYNRRKQPTIREIYSRMFRASGLL